MADAASSRYPSGERIVTEDPTDLEALASELEQIAKRLRTGTYGASGKPSRSASSFDDMRSSRGPGALPKETRSRRRFAQFAREAYSRRREREAIFADAELFGEPAWDMLLDLYIAHADEKPVSVSSACIGSASPPTTGLRWLGILAEQGLVVREHDPGDQRRVLVRLSEQGLAAMDAYFQSLDKSR